jgi:hypothetical protein
VIGNRKFALAAALEHHRGAVTRSDEVVKTSEAFLDFLANEDETLPNIEVKSPGTDEWINLRQAAQAGYVRQVK